MVLADGRYTLPERGEQLRPVLRPLAVFGVPEIRSGVQGDAVRGRWIATAIDARYWGDPGVRVVAADDAEVVIDMHGHELRGPPQDVMAKLADDA